MPVAAGHRRQPFEKHPRLVGMILVLVAVAANTRNAVAVNQQPTNFQEQT